MKLSTKLLAASLMISALAFQSCDLDKGENTQTYNLTCCNLFIPDDPNKDVSVQKDCDYSFLYDLQNGKVTVSSNNVDWESGKGSFESDAMPYKWYTYGSLSAYSFANGSGTFTSGSTTLELTSLSGMTTSATFFYTYEYDPIPVSLEPIMPSIRYKVGNTTVKTFSQNIYYSGTTTTSYQMGPEPTVFENVVPIYRVNIANDMKTANVVIYNIKFAEQMPVALAAVVLKDLPIEFNHNGFKISGSDIVPLMAQGSQMVPYEDRIFDSFNLETVNGDLTRVNCSFVCASMFHGSFSGQSTPNLAE